MAPAEGKSDIGGDWDLFAVRSILFLPASNPRAIDKARASAADLVVLDLEDAVKPADKDAARDAAVEAAEAGWPMPLAIRINGAGSDWHSLDIDAAARSKADFFIVPRANSARLLRGDREAVGKPVLAMIETAAGVLAAGEVAAECTGLIAGTNDLRADLRLPLDAGRKPINAALQLIVLAARAAGVPVFDGVYNQLKDAAGLTEECREGRMLGFDGKSLIHPDQIEPCNRIFGPSEAELVKARELVAAFDGGAQRFDDEMIERMHVEAARRLLARAGR